MYEGRSELNAKILTGGNFTPNKYSTLLNDWPKEQYDSFFKYTSITKALVLLHEREQTGHGLWFTPNSDHRTFKRLDWYISNDSKKTWCLQIECTGRHQFQDLEEYSLKVKENSRLLMMYARTQAATQIWIEGNGFNIKILGFEQDIHLALPRRCDTRWLSYTSSPADKKVRFDFANESKSETFKIQTFDPK